jgi:hypothetical protein
VRARVHSVATEFKEAAQGHGHHVGAAERDGELFVFFFFCGPANAHFVSTRRAFVSRTHTTHTQHTRTHTRRECTLQLKVRLFDLRQTVAEMMSQPNTEDLGGGGGSGGGGSGGASGKAADMKAFVPWRAPDAITLPPEWHSVRGQQSTERLVSKRTRWLFTYFTRWCVDTQPHTTRHDTHGQQTHTHAAFITTLTRSFHLQPPTYRRHASVLCSTDI